MEKRYVVRLRQPERSQLLQLVNNGKSPAYRIKHANILLKVDADGPCWSDKQTAEAFGCHGNTVKHVRKRFVEQGLERALGRKKQQRPSVLRRLDGEGEAHLIALSCSEPPPGRGRWTLHLLADKLVELRIVDSICYETVRQTLEKTNSSRICAKAGSSRRAGARTLSPTWKTP